MDIQNSDEFVVVPSDADQQPSSTSAASPNPSPHSLSFSMLSESEGLHTHNDVMGFFLKPRRLIVEHFSPEANLYWKHWRRTFENYLKHVKPPTSEKLNLLMRFISPIIYSYISSCDTFESAMNTLEALYNPPKNELVARYMLYTCKQKNGESLDQFRLRLEALARDCHFKDVTAEEHRNEAIRDTFLAGLQSPFIRQRLFEKNSVDLQSVVEEARLLEMVQKHCSHVNSGWSSPSSVEQTPRTGSKTKSKTANLCEFCGLTVHPRVHCAAKNAICNFCGKKGHFQRVCRTRVAFMGVSISPD